MATAPMTCLLMLPSTLFLQASSAASADDFTLDLSKLDVAAVVYDSAEAASFEHAVQLAIDISTAAGESLPVVLVATKDDLGMSNVSPGLSEFKVWGVNGLNGV